MLGGNYMYYQNYEDYMRSVLGYPVESQNTYLQNSCYETFPYTSIVEEDRKKQIEILYPEIYQKLKPVICNMCENNTKSITKELIEEMTNQIYQSIEIKENAVVSIRVQTRNEEKSRSGRENREEETRQQRRPNQDSFLRDLIKILILNQLLGNDFPVGRPPHPPFPGPGTPPPPRPPFPGGPRPPMPRDYDNYLKF